MGRHSDYSFQEAMDNTVLTASPANSVNTLPGNSRQRVKQFMQNLQDQICTGLEKLDGKARFREDCWQRAEGGEGRTRVIREGRVFEQGGVNFSEVWGDKLPTSIYRVTSTGAK